MEQNLKIIFYAMGAMILAPQTLSAQSVNIEGLDSLRLSGSVSVVEPELLKKGVLNNALDALSGQTAGVNVTTNGLDRIAMLNSVRVRGTTSIMGGNDPWSSLMVLLLMWLRLLQFILPISRVLRS